MREKKSRWLVYGVLSAIIAILGLIVIPMVHRELAKRRAARDGNSFGEIAKLIWEYDISGSNTRALTVPLGSTVHAAALILARYQQMNDASLYFLPNDPLGPKKTPKRVAVQAIDGTWTLDPDFANSTLSLQIASNLSFSANITNVPVLWTRGLQPNGTWSKDSPWAGKGGHIVYLDGNRYWYSRLDASDPKSSLFKYGTNVPTANIREALPPGAVILSAAPRPGK